jgi:hypothetical protein
VEDFGKAKIDFFRQRLPDLESIPSHDTFNRFFSLLQPGYFERIFRHWMFEICQKYEGVVAIDGKIIRGASKCTAKHPTVHRGLNSIWSVLGLSPMGSV